MAKSAVKSKSPANKSAANRPAIVEVNAKNGDAAEPPPPEPAEPDPELTPEEAEQARKDYLLTRFWISARGYWSRNGDRLAWAFSIGLLFLIVANVGVQYGINLWNRAIFDAIEQRDAATVFHLSAVFFPLAIGSCIGRVVRHLPNGFAVMFAATYNLAEVTRLITRVIGQERPLAAEMVSEILV